MGLGACNCDPAITKGLQDGRGSGKGGFQEEEEELSWVHPEEKEESSQVSKFRY